VRILGDQQLIYDLQPIVCVCVSYDTHVIFDMPTSLIDTMDHIDELWTIKEVCILRDVQLKCMCVCAYVCVCNSSAF